MSVALPEPGATIVIVDEYGREHRSQVTASPDERHHTLVRPDDVAVGDPLLIGDRLTLTWPVGDAAVGMVRARLTAMRREEERQLWDVEITDAAWSAQRRAHVRVEATGPVTISLRSATDDAAPVRSGVGELLDISEVALRLHLPVGQVWAGRRGAAVVLNLALDGAEVDLLGHVMSSRVRADDSRREVVVRFDQPVPDPESLRTHLDGLSRRRS